MWGLLFVDFVTQCAGFAQTHFKLDSLRPAQKEVLLALEKHRYVLATLPTGAGKTLLYALPALVFSQTNPVLVLSPLISLMRDQTRRMHEANVPCVTFTSEQNEEERKQSWHMLRNEKACLIFASPERMKLPSFLEALSKIKLSMVVVDEAHCVVSWGHHFRPEYAEIGKVLSILKPPRILALTATASKNSRVSISQKVFPDPSSVFEYTSKPLSDHIFVKSVRVFSHVEQWLKLAEILKKSDSEKIIVYFQTRKQCEEFAKKCRAIKIHAIVYHAGLSKQERSHAEQYAHLSTQKMVICATTAFGMGVDISGVRLVVVYGFPGNIEEFFQMLGRAGRAGEASTGILLWSGSDPIKREYQLKSTFPSPSAFIEKCRSLSAVMPALDSEKTFVEATKVEGILNGLRICDSLEEIIENETYYQLKLDKKIALDDLLADLPMEMTKRRKVLNSIQLIASHKWSVLKGAQTVISLKMLMDASSLTKEIFEQVFVHYSSKNSLQFVIIEPEHAKRGIILKNGFSYLQKELTRYVACRNHFFSSLHELNKLSTATTCRLMASFDFFVSGLKAQKYCMQCDLCAKNTDKGCVTL